jgi:tRNA-2-methylthio-N6-dimethylallyladenosine synthase
MKQVFLETHGCQMNVADTDRMEALLFHSGYLRTDAVENADLIIVNTCSIREKAVHKIYSLFGTYRPMKERNPDLILGLTGCLAQQEGESLVKRAPHINFVMGPDGVDRVVEVVQAASTSSEPRIWIEFDKHKEYSIPEIAPLPGQVVSPSAFVNIIKGCDKFCSFCVVPYTRGREKSRTADEICAEARQLIDRGAREIILLGQNVNAYGKRDLEPPLAFHELLYRVAEIPGLERLRFTTSHPRDFTPETVAAFGDLDVLANHLHLPVQSGSDRVLEEMRRGHGVDEYLGLIQALRDTAPDIEFSTDIIVGFPSETERDFEMTLELMEKVGFSNSYMFQYSARPNTPAADWPDTSSEDEKKRRLQKTIDLQNRLTQEQGQRYLGKSVEVLVEGLSRRSDNEGTPRWRGRTPHYWSIQFDDPELKVQPGDLVTVQVEGQRGQSLFGSIMDCHERTSRKNSITA